jgi:hypothetical protein
LSDRGGTQMISLLVSPRRQGHLMGDMEEMVMNKLGNEQQVAFA